MTNKVCRSLPNKKKKSFQNRLNNDLNQPPTKHTHTHSPHRCKKMNRDLHGRLFSHLECLLFLPTTGFGNSKDSTSISLIGWRFSNNKCRPRSDLEIDLIAKRKSKYLDILTTPPTLRLFNETHICSGKLQSFEGTGGI